MTSRRPYGDLIDRLKTVGLRPTRQRLALARLLFGHGDRHLTAEQLHGEAVVARVPVSLATVYNTLHQFTDKGLLCEIIVEPGRSYFDTNVTDHHHFFHEDSCHLEDIAGEDICLGALPQPPKGKRIRRIDVIIRVHGND
ncbi:MAG: iron response transcriptional regulator IrrA [Alphaproteobacteria bacterium]